MSFFDFSIQAANRLYAASCYALSAGLLLTVASALVLIWSGSIRTRYVESTVEDTRQIAVSTRENVTRLDVAVGQVRRPDVLLEADEVKTREHTAALENELTTLEISRNQTAAENAKLNIQLEQERTSRLKLEIAFAPRPLEADPDWVRNDTLKAFNGL